MTCHYLDCTAPVAAPGLSRCDEHRLRWTPTPAPAPLGAPREPAWLVRAKAQPHGLARPLDRSAA